MWRIKHSPYTCPNNATRRSANEVPQLQRPCLIGCGPLIINRNDTGAHGNHFCRPSTMGIQEALKERFRVAHVIIKRYNHAFRKCFHSPKVLVMRTEILVNKARLNVRIVKGTQDISGNIVNTPRKVLGGKPEKRSVWSNALTTKRLNHGSNIGDPGPI